MQPMTPSQKRALDALLGNPLAQSQAQIKQLKSANAKLSAQNEALSKKNAALTDKINDVSRALRTAQTARRAAVARREHWKGRCRELSDYISKYQRELVQLRKEVRELLKAQE